jgi:hypothetical protein
MMRATVHVCVQQPGCGLQGLCWRVCKPASPCAVTAVVCGFGDCWHARV